jgi:hypothetical protein
MVQRDPAKRIPKFLGTDATLIGTYTISDAAVALFPAVVVLLIVQVLLPNSVTIGGYPLQTLTLPLAGLAVLVGALFVFLTPGYTSSIEWIGIYLGWLRSSNEHDFEDAKQYTQLARLHPAHDALERTDGAFVGMIQVDPPTMALATDAEWSKQATAFAGVLNSTVEFPIQLYSTTQDFPVEEYLAHYDDRLDDPDIKNNPKLARLIEAYRSWSAEDVTNRQMTIRDHYVIVPVTPREVQFDQKSILQQLARLPILGAFLSAWFAPRVIDEQQAMFDELDSRIRRLEGGLREIEGCGTARLSAEESLAVLGQFWTQDDYEAQRLDALTRTRPVTGEATP